MLDDGQNTGELISLYQVEANLVQQKVGHILVIRSLAVTVFSGILGAALLSPTKGVEFVSLTIVLFYYFDAIYDAYLIPIVDREGALREALAEVMEGRKGVGTDLAAKYRLGITHRLTPEKWSPFARGLLEPQRIGLYLALALSPILLIHGPSLVRGFLC